MNGARTLPKAAATLCRLVAAGTLCAAAVGRAAAAQASLPSDPTVPPARRALSAGLAEVGPALALTQRIGDWPLALSAAAGPIAAGASAQLHLPALTPADAPAGAVAYASGGVMRFLRARTGGNTPFAWTAQGGVQLWPAHGNGLFADLGVGVWGVIGGGS
ncbi:MAG TPA: hypothetical protein VKA84_16555, partial [Gemmatimonadaceae bacterium]|nr:hypothetical protein [Gemmatimonadaceae bacterium]